MRALDWLELLICVYLKARTLEFERIFSGRHLQGFKWLNILFSYKQSYND